jgi:hypothetical protein
VISLGLLLLVAGCSPEPDVTATESDNNHHIQLKTDDVFDIVLADDYETTGCRWHDLGNHDWAILRDLGQRYQGDRTARGSSSGGTYTATSPFTRAPRLLAISVSISAPWVMPQALA